MKESTKYIDIKIQKQNREEAVIEEDKAKIFFDFMEISFNIFDYVQFEHLQAKFENIFTLYKNRKN